MSSSYQPLKNPPVRLDPFFDIESGLRIPPGGERKSSQVRQEPGHGGGEVASGRRVPDVPFLRGINECPAVRRDNFRHAAGT